MAKFCSECGVPLNDGVRFCNECGTKTEAPVQIQSPPGVQEQPSPPPAPTVTHAAAGTKPIGTLGYIGYIFLMELPFVGLVLSILWSIKKGASDRRRLARAMILFSIISIIVCTAMAIMLFIYTQVVDDLHFKLMGIQIF